MTRFALLALSLAAFVPAGAEDLDLFTTTQPLLEAPSGTTSGTATTAGADILGGERDARIVRLSGISNVAADMTGGSALIFSTGTSTTGEVELVWDGVDGDADRLDPTGLGGVDLTSMAANAFRLRVSSNNVSGVIVVLEVFTSGTESSVRSAVIPAVGSPREFFFSFSGFSTNRGAGADFTNVGAVRLFLRGGDDLVLALDAVTTAAATPDVAATLTENVSSALPGDTLDYEVTIENRGGDGTGASFQDTLDPNTTLVPGSIEVGPIAYDDVYASASAPLNVAAGAGVLSNDVDLDGDLPLSVVSSDTTSARGGTVAVLPTGAFDYTPAPGSEGIPDTFTYTADDTVADGLTSTAVVTVTLADAGPAVTGTAPLDGAVQQPPGTNVTLDFSESMNATTASFTLDCGGPVGYSLSSSPASSFTLDPGSDLPGGTCTVTVHANAISDLDTNDPPDGLSSDFVFDFSILAAPVVTTTGGSTAFVEDGGAVVVDAGITVADADDLNLASATVTLTNAQDGAAEVLAATNCAGLTVTPGLHSLSLSGSQPVATYQTCLASVSYDNTSVEPDETARTIDFVVSDGGLSSPAASKNVTVAAVNDVPVLTAGGTLSYTENDPATAIDATLTVADEDDASLASATVQITANFESGADVLSFLDTPNITGSFNPATGTLTLTGTDTLASYQAALRSVAYRNTSEAPSTSTRTVTWIGHDGTDPSAGVTSTIDVTAVNDPPEIASPAEVNATEDVAFSFTGGDAISVSDPDAGAATSFQVTLGVSSGTLNVSPAGGLTIGGNGTANVTLTGTAAVVSTALGTLAYTPGSNFNGSDALAIGANDGGNTGGGGPQTDMASGTIDVAAVNDEPVALAKLYAAQANMRVNGLGGLLSGVTDADTGTGTPACTPTFTVASLTPVSCGGCSVANLNAAAGTFDFLPGPGFTGAATLAYTVSDDGCPASAESAPAAITVNVAGPVIWFVDSSFGGASDGTLTSPFTTLGAATAAIGASTNQRIFLANAASYAANPTLNQDAWLVGQGVTGASFDAVFGIAPPAGTVARPSIGQPKPAVLGTLTAHNNANVRGLTISSGTGSGLVASSRTGILATDLSVTTTSGTGVSLTSTTANFTGGNLSISTTSGAGFVASGAGTIQVTGAGNTISTQTGTALSVSNTTIGSSGLTFQSLSAGTAASGPANGILLNNTGASGGLTVTGTGSAGSGGTIQRTTGVGVLLTSTADVSLSWMNVQNAGDDGIRGQGVDDFALLNSNLLTNGNATAENGLQFGEASGSVSGITGTLTLTNTHITGSAGNNVHIRNTSGTLAAMNVTGGSFSDLNDVTGANAFLFEMSGTAVTTAATISGATFANNSPQRALEVQAHQSGTIAGFTVTGCTFNDNGIHASFTQDTEANLTFAMLDNTSMLNANPLHAINVFSSATSTGGSITGTIQGNVIGNSAVASSGARGNGIRVFIQGRTTAVLRIQGNTLRQIWDPTNGARGMDLSFLGSTAGGFPIVQSDITITNNDVDTMAPASSFPLAAIFLAADDQGSPARVRADITGNNARNSVGGGSFDYGTFDGNGAHLVFVDAGGSAEAQLVDTPPASANATIQLTSSNTGTVYTGGVILIGGPINTP